MTARWLTAAEVAAKLRVSARHFRERACFRPGFPVPMRPVGGRPLWREDEIDAWCEAQRQPSRSATSAMEGA